MGNQRLFTSKEVRPISRVLGQAVTPLRCGVEHEYRVLAPTGPVDFRELIHTLDVPGRRLDPADPNAYRCNWGGALTVDGREAEIATPPIALERGCAKLVVDSTERGRQCLLQVLPPGLWTEGYSTHINVSV